MSKKVAILLHRDYEDLEYWYPYLRLQEEGLVPCAVGKTVGEKQSSKHGYTAEVQVGLETAFGEDYVGLVIPGGWLPDHLRTDAKVVDFIRHFVEQDKPIAAICHGPSLLIEADGVKGKTVTSFPSIAKDLENAGATWVDRPVATDQGLVTSRTPDDLPQFMKSFLGLLKEQ